MISAQFSSDSSGKACAGSVARVVEEHVDPAVGVDGLRHGGRHGGAVGDVAAHERGIAARGPDRILHCGALRLAPRHQHHAAALAGECMGGGLADTAVAAGHNRDTAVESSGHGASFLVGPSGRPF